MKTTNLRGNKLPILCVQEHFVLRGNSYIIQKALPNCHIIFKPAIKENQNYGRPRNGMFIAVPDQYKERFSDVSPAHWRVQAVMFESVLIINVYLPTDPGTVNFDDEELNETLEVIKTVVELNQTSKVIITGDFNSDFKKNTGQVRTVRTFIEDLNLTLSWARFPVDYTHMSIRDDLTFVHTLDHFFWGEDTDQDILDAGVIHHIDNDSDHSPIYCNLVMSEPVYSEQKIPKNQNSKPIWKSS